MLCVSIAQTSRTLAKVDMVNAEGLADMIELRLDRFDQMPNLKEMFEGKRRPVIIGCRRVRDGGFFEGPEDARLSMLREAVVQGADFVELEVDIAKKVPRYGPTQRVISYTNIAEAPPDLEEIYRECRACDPDVIKITTPTRGPEEAFPIVKLIAKGAVPTVAVGLGRAGVTLNVLGRRYKAPWTYAALEKGMEAYPGMATISELREIYDYDQIDHKTPLLGVTGFDREHLVTAQVLNAGFRLSDSRTRCVPLMMGDPEAFAKVVDAIKLRGILIDWQHRATVLPVLQHKDQTVDVSGAADFVACTPAGWQGSNTTYRAVRSAIEGALRDRGHGDEPLAGKTVLVIGCGAMGMTIAASLNRRGARILLADPDNELANRCAGRLGARYVPRGHVYSTIADGVVLTCDENQPVPGRAAIEYGKNNARENIFAVDMTNFPFSTPFLDEVNYLGGLAIPPQLVFMKLMQMVLRSATGREFSDDELLQAVAGIDFSA